MDFEWTREHPAKGGWYWCRMDQYLNIKPWVFMAVLVPGRIGWVIRGIGPTGSEVNIDYEEHLDRLSWSPALIQPDP